MIDKDLTLQQVWKSGKWIKEKASDGSMNPLWITLLPQIISCLEDIYPGNWDLAVECRTTVETVKKTNLVGYKYEVLERRQVNIQFHPVIYFDELHITNSNGNEHVIRDLYVRIHMDINEGQLSMLNLSGTRGTVTIAEWINNYFHSHISWYKDSDDPDRPYHNYQNEWCNFCLGEGHIRDMMVDIGNDFDCDLFQMILIHIKDMMEWESLEGVPYRNIDKLGNINANMKTRSLIYFTRDQMENYYQHWKMLMTTEVVAHGCIPAIRTNVHVEVIDFSEGEGPETCITVYPVAQNQEAYQLYGVDMISEAYEEAVGINPLCIMVGGEYRTMNDSQGDSIIPDLSHFQNFLYFQGKEVIFSVSVPEDFEDHQNQQRPNYLINPNLVSYVNNRIKEETDFNLYRNSAIKAYRRYPDAGKLPAESEVPVPHDTEGGVVWDTTIPASGEYQESWGI
jgi:hypothetical protein